MDQLTDVLLTGAGILWKALWALVFGYLVSAGIQVLVSREQTAGALGERVVVVFLVVGAALVWVHARSGRNETAFRNA